VAPIASPGTESQRPAAIETHDLTKRFGERRAVDSLSIRVPRGVIAGLVGPNGAGKKTTLRMLLGLIRPTDGSASVLGESIRHPRAFMHSVGALIEGPAFYPTLSGRTNLSTLGRHRDADISGLLQTVGLADRARHKVSSYSLGMKQRLGIAAALLGEHGRVRRLRRHRNIVDASAHRGMSGLVRPDPRLNAERQPARPAPNLHSRTVILVDDGVATGATIRAAIAVVRAQQRAQARGGHTHRTA
jgi:ABC-type thiamine transport system ATPase subunit